MLPILLLIIFIMINQSQISVATEAPIIGILAQETSRLIKSKYPLYDSYIAASYVKYVESSGARVVPIVINQSVSYYRKLIKSVNGVLLPGGNAWFTNHGGYADAGNIIIRLIKEENEKGNRYPILGVCLGFQLLTYVDAGKIDLRVDCVDEDEAKNLNFKGDYNKTNIFKSAPIKIINILKKENVTYNSHRFCVTEAGLKQYGIEKKWKVVAWNTDQSKTVDFISIAESTEYPFLGLQFHPEKNVFEWNFKKAIPHFPNALIASRYFSDWLVKEARKNNNTFTDQRQERNSLIYNYKPTYTGVEGLAFEQLYFF